MVKIEVKIEDVTALLSINGEVDASSSIQLDESLAAQLSASVKSILIDCTRLDYISSAGLGVFMSYIEEFKANNQQFVLFGLSKKVENVFDMLGLVQLMNIVTTKEDALKLANEG